MLGPGPFYSEILLAVLRPVSPPGESSHQVIKFQKCWDAAVTLTRAPLQECGGRLGPGRYNTSQTAQLRRRTRLVLWRLQSEVRRPAGRAVVRAVLWLAHGDMAAPNMVAKPNGCQVHREGPTLVTPLQMPPHRG